MAPDEARFSVDLGYAACDGHQHATGGAEHARAYRVTCETETLRLNRKPAWHEVPSGFALGDIEMAFDKKRLHTFQWLDNLAKCKARYADKFPRHPDIMVYSGSLYATDGTVLAKVDYPEFYHLSDCEWSKVIRCFANDEGKLLEIPDIELMDRQYSNNRIFDDMFIKSWHRFDCCVNPLVMKNCLKPFEINSILPNVCTDERKIELLGHNDDVSIRVLMMGVRR